jgi:hypothetical protein
MAQTGRPNPPGLAGREIEVNKAGKVVPSIGIGWKFGTVTGGGWLVTDVSIGTWRVRGRGKSGVESGRY